MGRSRGRAPPPPGTGGELVGYVAARLGKLAALLRRADPCGEEEDPGDVDVGELAPPLA